jgi:DNA replication protein DnaC
LGGEPKTVLAEVCQSDPDKANLIYAYLYSRRRETPDERIRRERHEEVLHSEFMGFLQGVDSCIPRSRLDFDGFVKRPKFPDVQTALKLVQDWMAGLTPGLVTLSGGTGVGKSHLAIAAARQLAAVRKPLAYRTEAQFVAEIQGGIKNNSSDHVLGELCQVPWLVLDEMFISGIGNWTAAKLDGLIQARWEGAETLRTLITTNAISKDLSPRISSRLGDIRKGKTLIIHADDWRRNGGKDAFGDSIA